MIRVGFVRARARCTLHPPLRGRALQVERLELRGNVAIVKIIQ